MTRTIADAAARCPDTVPLDFKLLDGAARITRETDRARVDAALVSVLSELWAVERALLYRIDDPDTGTCQRLVEYSDGNLVHHESASGAAQERLEDVTGARQALARGEASCRVPGNSATAWLFPIKVRQDHPTRLLELVARRADPEPDGRLVRSLVQLYRNHVKVIEHSERDTLTGLRNRRTFDQLLMRLVQEHPPGGPPGAGSRRHRGHARALGQWLAVVDIDRFKRINDTYGHLFGDEVLILVANLMRAAFRIQDALFRFGGEEFVVLLQEVDRPGAQAAVERFRAELASRQFPQVGQVTVSIGYTEIIPGQLPSEILNRADAALYFGKEHGRNRCCCYETLVDDGELAPTPCFTGSGFELF